MLLWIAGSLMLVVALAVLVVAAAWLRQRRTEGSRPGRTRAWDLTEGTELPGDVVILQVDREPLLGSVRVLTDQPINAISQYRADDLVEVIRLAG